MFTDTCAYFSSRATADAIAAANNADDDAWSYVVEDTGNGTSYVIAIYDQEEIFVGHLG